ncbi:TIGR03085 family metal-binding protein [Corynebacterium tapiri]|uniref:TIGR03085 family protein n=1 Tax=Corynebacterium tapiri TaxID=1448266 RepID=A0A5C4U6X5_9CORY|nr:TIGR03085 family metal-binding protein [Corynebacterium tapiri]TNL99251.1 TIGR03085 family protein [Corynebacterium tapiri]
MSFAASERRQLAQLLHAKGPDAPTLCEGWTTRDLAAHLFVREHNLPAAAGMFVSPLENKLEAAMDEARARDYDALIDAWAAGAPKWNPMKYADSKVNAAENFIHHEDVRRGGGEIKPREFSQVVNDQLINVLKRFSKVLLRGSDKPVVLTPRGAKPIIINGKPGVAELGDDVIRVTGEPGELVLWMYGRDAAEVEVQGDPSALKRGV